MIWRGTEQEFEKFIKELNEAHPTIKFDYEISDSEVNFLDTTVFINKSRNLKTKLYRKPTDRQNYLHLMSEHPPSLKRSIPFSQALRIRKICSEDSDLKTNIEILSKTFIKRGYKSDMVKEQMNKAILTPRYDILKQKSKESSNRIPLTLIQQITSTIKKHSK